MDSPSRGLRHILHDGAVPFFAFSVTLAALLVLSWLFLLPRLTRIAVQGMLLDPPHVEQYAANVQNEITELSKRVDEFVYPTRDPLYAALRAERSEHLSPDDLRAVVNDAIGRTTDGREAVAVTHLSLTVSDGSALIEGAVGKVGPRSITVLAAFVDALRASPGVSDVAPSAFTREDDPVTGPFSPFSIRFTLRRDVP